MTTDPQEDCLFCRIAAGHEGRLIWESDNLAAFHDIHPAAPTHILIVPKRHIASLAEADKDDHAWLGDLLLAAVQLAEKEGIAAKGYRTVINIRDHGGQGVDHLHLHLLGGTKLGPLVVDRDGCCGECHH